MILTFVLAAAAFSRQTTPPAAQPVAKPSDVDSVDHIMAALYDVISGPIGQKRDPNRLKSLFMPKAMMAAVYPNRNGELRESEFAVDRYASQSLPQMEKSGFFEHEVSRKTEEFGHIVSIFSTYESRYKLDDKSPFERGINSLQLFNDGKRWWIRTILWEGETGTLKLPKKYLP
jgi:hypothetical protein